MSTSDAALKSPLPSRIFLFGLAGALLVAASACAPGSTRARARHREFPPRGITVDVLRPGPAVPLYALSTVNFEIWAGGAGAALVRSTRAARDLSTTWTSGQIGDDPSFVVRDIELVNRTTLVALATDDAGRSRVYLSVNAGATWTLVLRDARPEGSWRALAMWPYRYDGVLLGDPVDGRFTVLTTHDAGATWRRPDLLAPPEALPGERLLTEDGSCLTVGPNNEVWFGTGGSTARVFRSGDKGLTWEVADTPLARGHGRAGVYSISFLTRSIGIAVGGDPDAPDERTGSAAWTFDSGHSWSATVEVPPAGFRSSVVFTHIVERAILGTTAVAVGPSGADLSLDYGRTWHPMPAAALPGERAVELTTVAAQDGGRDFVAAAANGAIVLYSVPHGYDPSGAQAR